jgi:hypothetical protein
VGLADEFTHPGGLPAATPEAVKKSNDLVSPRPREGERG